MKKTKEELAYKQLAQQHPTLPPYMLKDSAAVVVSYIMFKRPQDVYLLQQQSMLSCILAGHID